MENAGRAASFLVDRLFSMGPIVVAAGGGNNGGDALVVARILTAWGREVTLVCVGDGHDRGLLHGWDVPTLDASSLEADGWAGLMPLGATVVDGILGTGQRGAPREPHATAIEQIVRVGRPVVALDVPSGVNADDGSVPGASIWADMTVAFGSPKLGTLLHPGRERVGRLVAVEIGFPPMSKSDAGARVITGGWAGSVLPERALNTHKNAVGRVLIVAGGPEMPGAAVLSARAAFRSGAGLVQVCAHPDNRGVLQAAVPEAIFVSGSDAEAVASAVERADTIAVGPGLGTDDWAASLVSSVLGRGSCPLVLDADALTLLADGAVDGWQRAVRQRPTLITPHAGEMRRLRPQESSNDRVDQARAAADALGVAVLFKGAPSFVAVGDGPVWLSSGGSSDLAVAGMGDVLTGVCAALAAQGLAPEDAGAVALHLTGTAARAAARGAGMIPSDVVERLPDALRDTRAPGSDLLEWPFVTFDEEAPW